MFDPTQLAVLVTISPVDGHETHEELLGSQAESKFRAWSDSPQHPDYGMELYQGDTEYFIHERTGAVVAS